MEYLIKVYYIHLHIQLLFCSALLSDFFIRPEFFYFSFYRTSRPNFLEIEKTIKEIVFNFIFYFPPTHASTVLEFSYVFFVLSFLLLPG